MTPQITPTQLQDYRTRTFRYRPEERLQVKEDAIRFVNERGFVYFWPIKDITFPSLWTAVAGDRPVANEHGDAGHVTWGWKDELLGQRQWHYGKILRSKATMIALDVLPYFYALSENYGDPEQDYLQLYEEGLLTREAKLVYETLLTEGPLDTVNLRRIAHMTSKDSNSPFDRAITLLQRDFKLVPVGVSQAGAWRYSFIYDLVHRHYPDLAEQSRPITRRAAREKLLGLYFDSIGAATAADALKLFQWKAPELEKTIHALVDSGRLRAGYQLSGRSGDFYVSAEML